MAVINSFTLPKVPRRMRFWVDMGTREGERGAVPDGIKDTRRLVGQFDAAGLLPGRDYYYWEVAGGEHNEAHWGARFDRMLLYFFGRRRITSSRATE